MSLDIHSQKKRGWLSPPEEQKEYLSLDHGGQGEPTDRQVPFEKRGDTHSPRKSIPKKLFIFILLLILGSALSFGVFQGLKIKNRLLEHGTNGARELEQAIETLKQKNVTGAEKHFSQAFLEFHEAESLLRGWGTLIDALHFVPGFNEVASGKNLIEAGTHFARAGEELNFITALFLEIPSASEGGHGRSLLQILLQADPHIRVASAELRQALEKVEAVDVRYVPVEKRPRFLQMREALPAGVALLDMYTKHVALFEELLGGNGPRKYLFLFQNNHELRATGGFIGSYALLDITDGRIRQFFVDGIFNPDGQLKENIIPPEPIQKISAGWSLHDSNWFPDFPVSAEKAIFFYEKTGGPTVDGIVTLTPTIMKRLLAITGPITLPDYGVTIDAENFMTIVQEEVEVGYDREENNPKKILSDLMNALLERLLLVPDLEHFQKIAKTFTQGLNERHILIYSRHAETESLIDAAGWSGRVLTAPHDYLSVIHTNINGYKTDGVIAETITHQAKIESDGSIVDTVTIMRKHNGGDTPYVWWNKVNADYLRVYVPLGSELLSAEGTTREFIEPPLDYEALGFREDPDVVREEQTIALDPESGTRIGEDAGKTVFGNWVYVSPGEAVTVRYRYRLPGRLALRDMQAGDPVSYSMLYQKQSGTEGISLSGSVEYPAGIEPVWQTGENLIPYGRTSSFQTTLDENQFFGIVFKKP